MANYFDNTSAAASSHAYARSDVERQTSVAARNSSKRRVAFLGAGYIADRHAKALASIAGIELVAVCDRVSTRAESFAAKFHVRGVYGSLEAMLAAEQLDAVHVLLPPDLHFEAAETILNAGVNAFIEKPMCLNPEDAATLTRLADERRLKIGVGHNFLFSECYERLRDDLRQGILGSIDQLTISWHRELPQVTSGPFDLWMLREPGNVMFEVGPHCVAQMLDLVGVPETMEAVAGNPVDLPSGQKFYRRWHVNASKGSTAIELRFSFVPGFGEYTIQARGSLASAAVDFDRDLYSLCRHRPLDEDFDRYAMVAEGSRNARKQARRTLRNYVASKLHLRSNGTPYGTSIAAILRAFYATVEGEVADDRIAGHRGAEVIRICKEVGRLAAPPIGCVRKERRELFDARRSTRAGRIPRGF